MFTIEQIKSAHSKVKSGADFPVYIQDIKKLGVHHYETFVNDGHSEYFGLNNYQAATPAKYGNLPVSGNVNKDQFKADLKAHQQGKTDYFTFCKDCALSGIWKWTVNTDKMTCIYYDKTGNEVLTEIIPK